MDTIDFDEGDRGEWTPKEHIRHLQNQLQCANREILELTNQCRRFKTNWDASEYQAKQFRKFYEELKRKPLWKQVKDALTK